MVAEYEIKKLDWEQTTAIYKTWLIRHFPKDEIRPLVSLKDMWSRECYQTFAMYIEENLVAYAFFAEAPDCELVLLDYFAVLEEYRSQNVGSIFFGELRNQLPQIKGILIETESVDAARTEEEVHIRERRNAFYAKGGARQTEVVTDVYGVTYTIWNYPVTEAAGDQECREGMEKLYRNMMPKLLYRKMVEIH